MPFHNWTIRHHPQHFRRVAGHYRAVRDALGHHAAGAYDGPFPNGYVGENRRAGPDGGAFPDQRGLDLPVLPLFLQLTRRARRPGVGVVDETTPWPTKTSSSIVTPSQMKVWLEILQFLSDSGVLLDLDERADFGVVANLAAVEVDELRRA